MTRHNCQKSYCKIFHKLNNRGGYVAILLCAAIPVLLLGAKWAMDRATANKANIYSGSGTLKKRCAAEAALAVAKHWNPGLTLKQQKESLLRIADGVYNSSVYDGGPAVYSAIPGLGMRTASKTVGKQYDPLKLQWTMGDTAPSVAYTPVTVKLKRYNSSGGVVPTYVLYALSSMIARDSLFADDDYLVKNPILLADGTKFYASSRSEYGPTDNKLFSTAGVDSEDANYTKRTTDTDNKVQISVDGDKIKVLADDDIGYAVPAACNVDIVLAIPTNGAACNKDNRDSSSPTAGSPSFSSADDAATLTATEQSSTPIYQISQALKAFLKSNFEFTKGVNVGLIPYSGKFSIPPDRATGTNDWTEAIPPFIAGKPDSGAATTPYFLENQTTCPAYIRGAFLYGTSGVKDAALTSDSYTWGSTAFTTYSTASTNVTNNNQLTGILCRGNTTAESVYGNNQICAGDLLSADDPTATGKYKFRRMNCNPCYLGYANFLSMKCEKDCESFIPNPYFLIELSPDVGRIKYLLDMLIPIPDNKNVSNFIFLPVTWTNNLFQSWTRDTECEAVDTDGSETDHLGQLSCPSKIASTTNPRKKALILVVNKPDWFEPQELTYLGFDNDYSEIPMIESDCIRFDIDYTATARKFADGTAYNTAPNKNGSDPLIAGAKKILKYETTSGTFERNTNTLLYNPPSGFYETKGSGTVVGKLSFPQKYLVKVVVEPLEWPFFGDNFSARSFAYNGVDKFVAVKDNGSVYSSNDGITWTPTGATLTIGSAYSWCIAYGNGKWMVTNGSNTIATSTNNGSSWTYKTYGDASTDNISRLNYGNGIWMKGVPDYKIQTSTDGENWEEVGDISNVHTHAWYDFFYGNGKWIRSGNGAMAVSTDNGRNWARIEGVNINWGNFAYGDGKWMGIRSNEFGISVDNAVTWPSSGRVPYVVSNNSSGTCIFANGKFIVISNGDSPSPVLIYKHGGSLKFTNVTGNTAEHTVTSRREFYIEPSKISDTKDANENYTITFNMTNLRLISAEITNRPYTLKTPSCSLSGTTDALNKTNQTATITTTVKTPLTIKAKTSICPCVWTDNTSMQSISNSGWCDIAYNGNGKWMALNYSGIVAISSDNGATWAEPQRLNAQIINDSIKNYTFSNIIWHNNQWIAIVSNKTVVVSSDNGANWIIQNSNLSTIAENWRTLDRNSGTLAALGKTGNIAVSTDNGITWTSKANNLSTISANNWRLIKNCGGDKWMATTEYDGANAPIIAISTDNLATWTRKNNNLSNITGDKRWYNFAYDNGTLLAIHEHGYLSISTDDGATWTDKSGDKGGGWRNVCRGNGVWIAVHDDHLESSSNTSNDETWTWTRIDQSFGSTVMAYGNGILMGSKYTTAIVYMMISSDNGLSWKKSQPLSLIHSTDWHGLTYGNGKWIALNNHGYVATSSDDGATWTNLGGPLKNIQSNQWYKLAYGNGTLLAIHEHGYLSISTDDGATWIDKSGNKGSGWRNVCRGNGTWIAVHDSRLESSSNTSSDGTWTWKQIWSGSFNQGIGSIAYGNGILMGIKNTNNNYDIMISSDNGVSWEKNISFTDSIESRGIAYGNNKWIALKSNGVVSISDDPVKTGSIRYKNATDENVSMNLTNFTDQTFTISPETHKYVKNTDAQGNVTYTITLNLNNVQISEAQMVNTDIVCESLPLRLPAMSRTIDFTENINNNPKFESNLVVYSSNSDGTGNEGYRGAYYDEKLQRWCTMRSPYYTDSSNYGSFCHHFWNKGIEGDFYLSLDQINDEVAKLFVFTKDVPVDLNSKNSNAYNIPGFYRIFQPFNLLPEKSGTSFDLRLGNPKYAFIHGGFTYPVNAVLYNGTTTEGDWYKAGGAAKFDQTTAVSNATTDACAKLKTDHGSDIRIYVVKYRKQDKYKHKVTGTDTPFNYGYIDNCATDTAKVYDVAENSYKAGTASVVTTAATAEENLKKALQTIACDIKIWAGYSNAANVGATGTVNLPLITALDADGGCKGNLVATPTTPTENTESTTEAGTGGTTEPETPSGGG